MALAAKADVTGRFSTFIPAMQTLGAAVGPALGGMLVVGGSFTYVYLMSTVAWIVTVGLFFAARSRLPH
jgi:predicted MFS family arabinose efflux permease